MVALLGFALPVAAVWPLSRLVEGLLGRPGRIAFAFGLGTGLSSVTTIWLLAHGAVIGAGFILVDAAVWIALGIFAWWFTRHHGVLQRRVVSYRSPADWPVRAAFGLVAVLSCVAVWGEYLAAPHGQWDAWAIWNHRARFLFRAGSGWAIAMTPDASSHPDYPLLVPASVARIWAYAGDEPPLVPALLGVLFGVLATVVVIAAINRSRASWIGGAVLLAPAVFLQQAAAQCADVPLAFFAVAALAVVYAADVGDADTRVPQAAWGLSGTMSALAAWSKNEGLLFLAICAFLVAAVAATQRRLVWVIYWLAGVTPVLAAVIWFKVTLAPPVDLMQQSWATMAAKIIDPERHAMVTTLVVERIFNWGSPWAGSIFVLMLGTATVVAMTRLRSTGSRPIVAAIMLMLAGYYGAYVLTPHDAVWHVSTSADRLLTQIWPLVVLAAFRRGMA